MVSANIHNDDLNEIMESFYTFVKHPYIQKYVDDPIIDKDQITLLYLMMREKGLTSTYIKQCILTTILVQAALDTHESVSVKNLIHETSKKKRQLTVLAGDYYSSLYYFVLSNVNDIKLIRVLAQSIQEINESKMNMYQMDKTYSPEDFHDIKIIDSSLIQNIAAMLQLPKWKELINEFFFFKRLLKERLLFVGAGYRGQIVEMLIHHPDRKGKLSDDNAIRLNFELLIDASKDKLIRLTREWSQNESFFLSRIEALVIENQYEEQCVMEEG